MRAVTAIQRRRPHLRFFVFNHGLKKKWKQLSKWVVMGYLQDSPVVISTGHVSLGERAHLHRHYRHPQ
jgi:hypothetical protein